MNKHFAYMVLLAGLAVGSSAALADSVFVGTLERKDVKITSYSNGMVEFTIAGRAVAPVEAARISRMVIDDEPVFTAADQAFAENKWSEAVDGYIKAIATTKKPWLNDWMASRLLQAANRAGRFPEAVGAFVNLLQKDPNTAVANRPEVTARVTPAALATAAKELSRHASNVSFTAAQRQAAQALLMDVYAAQGDLASGAKVAKELVASLPAQSNDPAVLRTMATVHLSVASMAMAEKDPARALKEIRDNAALFTEPQQQVQAMYLLAAAQDAVAGQSPTAEVQKDVAIAYMRAVAASRSAGDTRFMPQAMFRAAQIEQSLGETKAAASLYAEVASEYKDNPLAAKAAEQYKQLSIPGGQ